MEWSELEGAFEGEALELKGFLFQSPKGEWILSQEPNLKSCCIGSLHKKNSQVTLLGDFSTWAPNTPLQVKGVLHKEGVYFLSEVSVVQKGGLPLWSLGAVALIVMVLAFKWRAKLKRLLLP